MRYEEEEDRRGLWVIILIIIGVIVGIALLTCSANYDGVDDGNGDDGNGDDPTPSFGNTTISGTYEADAKLLAEDGETEIGGGVEIASESNFFADDFETGDLSRWSVATNHISATDDQSYEGEWSCKFAPRCSWSIDYLRKNDAWEMDEDDGLNLYFAVNISGEFKFPQTQCICPKEYFIVKLEFCNGNTLTYIIAGTYWNWNPHVAILDVREQVDEADEWEVVKIENIQNDYYAQFGCPMPDSGKLKFQKRSWDGEVHLDAILLHNETIPDQGGHWTSEGVQTICYFVDVDFKVTVGDAINESNLWFGIWLYTTIENATDIVENDMLLQTILINVTQVGEWLSWRSGCFALAKNESIYGPELIYTLDIYVMIFGQVKSGEPNEFEWIIVENGINGFDTFSVSWFSYYGYWLTIIGLVIGGLGITGVAIGAKVRKKRKCECIGQPDCFCDI